MWGSESCPLVEVMASPVDASLELVEAVLGAVRIHSNADVFAHSVGYAGVPDQLGCREDL